MEGGAGTRRGSRASQGADRHRRALMPGRAPVASGTKTLPAWGVRRRDRLGRLVRHAVVLVAREQLANRPRWAPRRCLAAVGSVLGRIPTLLERRSPRPPSRG